MSQPCQSRNSLLYPSIFHLLPFSVVLGGCSANLDHPIITLILLPFSLLALLSPARKPHALLRGLILALWALSAGSPSILLPSPRTTQLYLQDTSASVQPSASPESHPADIRFARTPRMIGQSSPDPQGSDAAAALRLAIASAPPDGPLHIVLETDGAGLLDVSPGPTVPKLPHELAALANLGASLELRHRTATPPTSQLHWINHDGFAHAGSTLLVRLKPGVPAPPPPWKASLLLPDSSRVPLPDQTPTEGLLEISLPPDLKPGLVRLEVADAARNLWISEPPRVVLVGNDAGERATMANLFRARGASAAAHPPREAPPLEPEIDLLVLLGPSAADLPPGWLESLKPWLDAGGTLVVAGGPQGWAGGGWDSSPLGPLLPLRAEEEGAEEDLSLTLLLVVDKSGSMARQARDRSIEASLQGVSDRMQGGNQAGSRMRLAAEGAVEAIKRLRPGTDHFGLLSVDTEARWHIPLGPLLEPEPLARRARSLSAGGGGIFLTTALEAARGPILAAPTRLRHLVVFADAGGVGEQTRVGPPPASAMRIVGELRAAGVTLSVVGLGLATDPDAAFLAELAARGGGKVRLAEDARRLPVLFAQETERLLAPPPPETFQLGTRVVTWTPALGQILFARAPALRGRHKLDLRPGGELLLETSDGEPLLATRPQGLGRVYAFSIDAAAAQARPWLTWQGHSQLWAGLLREAQGPTHTGDTQLILSAHPSGQEVQVITRDPLGRSRSPLNLRLRITPLGGQAADPSAPIELPLSPTSPGVWRALLDLPPDSPYLLEVVEPDGSLTLSTRQITPLSPEITEEAPSPEALSALAITAGVRPEALRPIPLGPFLLFFGLLLLPLDAALRRRPPLRTTA